MWREVLKGGIIAEDKYALRGIPCLITLQKLKTDIDSRNKLKLLSKVNQDEITRLNELREVSEDMFVTEKNKFFCST